MLDELAERAKPIKFATFDDLRRFRGDVLNLISSCVSSVYVLEPRSVVSSLLIGSDSDETLLVIARSDCDRTDYVSYPRQGMLAWYAIEGRRVEVTGEVKRQYRGFNEVGYNSVMSLPIISGTLVLGAVSIDHPKPFLFDEREAMFQTVLRPYLRLLAMTFTHADVAESAPVDDDKGDAHA